MDDKNIEMMKKIIEDKKQKSANQGHVKRGPNSLGSSNRGVKKHKKGGVFDK